DPGGEHDVGGGDPAVEGRREVAQLDQVHAGGAGRGPQTGDALAAGPGGDRTGGHADPAVAERREVGDRLAHAVRVVGDDRGDVVHLAVEQHEGDVGGDGAQLVVGQ